MNLDFFVVMSNLVSLFVIIAVGYIAVKSGVLKQEASAIFSAGFDHLISVCRRVILIDCN